MPGYLTYSEIEHYGIVGYPACPQVNNWDGLLEAAARHMDSYLAKCPGVTVPLSAPNANHKRINGQIAVFWAFSVNGFNADSDIDTAVRQNFDDAISWLKSVAKCLVEPGVAIPGATPAEDSAAFVMSEEPRGWGFGGDPDEDFTS